MGTTYLTGTYSVIHSCEDIDFDRYVYSKVYFNDDGVYTINGILIAGFRGDDLDIIVEKNGTLFNHGFVLLGNIKSNIKDSEPPHPNVIDPIITQTPELIIVGNNFYLKFINPILKFLNI